MTLWPGIMDLLDRLPSKAGRDRALRTILLRLAQGLDLALDEQEDESADNGPVGDVFPIKDGQSVNVGLAVAAVSGQLEVIDPTGDWQGDNLIGLCTEMLPGNRARMASDGIATGLMYDSSVVADLNPGAALLVSGNQAGRLETSWPDSTILHVYHIGYFIEVDSTWGVKARLSQFRHPRQILQEV